MPALKIMKSGERKPFSLLACLMNGVIGVLLAVILLLVLSAIFLYADIDTVFIPYAAKTVLFVSAFLCGVFCGRRQKECGYLYGGCTGILYALFLLLIGLVTGFKQSVNMMSVLTVFLCAISGALGGIFGINLKNNKKRKRNA